MHLDLLLVVRQQLADVLHQVAEARGHSAGAKHQHALPVVESTLPLERGRLIARGSAAAPGGPWNALPTHLQVRQPAHLRLLRAVLVALPCSPLETAFHLHFGLHGGAGKSAPRPLAPSSPRPCPHPTHLCPSTLVMFWGAGAVLSQRGGRIPCHLARALAPKAFAVRCEHRHTWTWPQLSRRRGSASSEAPSPLREVLVAAWRIASPPRRPRQAAPHGTTISAGVHRVVVMRVATRGGEAEWPPRRGTCNPSGACVYGCLPTLARPESGLSSPVLPTEACDKASSAGEGAASVAATS